MGVGYCVIKNNTFYKNTGYAMKFDAGGTTIANNTIVGNGYGIEIPPISDIDGDCYIENNMIALNSESGLVRQVSFNANVEGTSETKTTDTVFVLTVVIASISHYYELNTV